jgi:undecaprenyl-diphosphatase
MGADPRRAHAFGIVAVVLAVLVGISRLYLGMHYPSDVICGLILGMICATIVHVVIKKAEQKRGIIGG